MQQKSKFIILISLICFISLLFVQGEVFGAEKCELAGKNCKNVYDPETGTSEEKCDGYEEVCVEVEEEETTPTTDTTKEKKEEGWKCTPKGLDGKCIKIKTSGSVPYKTLESCEEHCPYDNYLGCRKANFCGWPFQPPCWKKYCKTLTWYVTPKNDICSSEHARCIDCDDDTGVCSDSLTAQDYTSLDTCNLYCSIDPCSVTATADPNPMPANKNQVTISATNFSHTSIDKCIVTQPIPQTFTNIATPQDFQVSCT